MQAELEGCGDAEVASAAAERPEQLGVVLLPRDDDRAARRHDLRANETVAAESVLRGEVSDAAAERQPGDAGGADDPARRREPERLRGRVEVEPRRSTLGAGDPGVPVDVDCAHRREVDHETRVAYAVPGRGSATR